MEVVVAAQGSIARAKAILVYVREVTGVAHAYAQAAGDLVADATYVANAYGHQTVAVGAEVTLAVAASPAALVTRELTQAHGKASLRANFEEQTFAVVASIVLKQYRNIDV